MAGDSYHFLTETRGQYGGGDFYDNYSDGDNGNGDNFFANNIAQRGLIDLGNVEFDKVEPPASGYTQFGVKVVVGHIYVSLANDNELGHYIIFRVTSLESNSFVDIEYYYL